MTQPHRGSSRTEVTDLRNIVDRLDLLMGGPGPRSGHGVTSPRDEAVAALGERVEALEREVDELRTLVNHLMTIATWQARVTATLVDDRAGDDDTDLTQVEPEPQYGGTERSSTHARRGDDDGAQLPHGPTAPAATLDDDIDEILGADHPGPHHDPAPPDFGI